MPKYRQLHLKILESFDYNESPNDFTRVTWIHTLLIVDSAGRGIYNPHWLKSKLYPIRIDISPDEIIKAFDYFSSKNMIRIYKAKGREYFYIVNWAKYQSGIKKEAPSILPAPELLRSSAGESKDVGGLDYSESESLFESESKYSEGYASVYEADYITIFSSVTGMVGIPGNSADAMQAIDEFLRKFKGNEEKVINYLKPFWLWWSALKRGNGQPVSRTNLAWLTEHAKTGVIPSAAEPEQGEEGRVIYE